MDRLLSNHKYDLIAPQIKECKEFPGAIVEYLKITKIEDLEGDGYILLGKFYDDQTFSEFNEDNEFIDIIFNSFEILKAYFFSIKNNQG